MNSIESCGMTQLAETIEENEEQGRGPPQVRWRNGGIRRAQITTWNISCAALNTGSRCNRCIKGFSATNLQDVAARVGMDRATIYYYFFRQRGVIPGSSGSAR